VAIGALSSVSIIASIPYVLSVMPPPTVVFAPADVPPAEAQHMLESVQLFTTATIVLVAAISVCITILMIVGALRRWTWAFWVALVIFGLGAFGTILGAILSLLSLIGVTLPAPPGAVPVQAPPEPVVLQIGGWLLSAAETLTFVLMLIAAVRIGPWACRNEIAEDLPPFSTHSA
jgi:hypothetical protein